MIHVYTGDGKGKTTAALGLSFRAAGYGMRTLFIQFMKKGEYGETLSAVRSGELIIIEQYGTGEFYFPDSASQEEKKQHIEAAATGLLRADKVLAEKSFDIIVLDEILNVISLNLAEEDGIIAMLERSRENADIILTGRGASERIIQAADIVTEMKKIRHSFDLGAQAGKGLEY